MHGGLTGTETRSFNDSRRLSFTKWANNVPGIPDELKGGEGEMMVERVGGEGAWVGGGCLPVGRESERRILITATRTSSLGGTIWQCHTDAWNPVGCSLPLDAHFVHFGSWVGRGEGNGERRLGEWGRKGFRERLAVCLLKVSAFLL